MNCPHCGNEMCQLVKFLVHRSIDDINKRPVYSCEPCDYHVLLEME